MTGESRNGANAVRVEGAIGATYRRQATALRELAERKFRVPHGEAEALVNDVFTTLMLRPETVRDPEKWLVGAVCHACRDYWRKNNRTEPLPADIDQYSDPASSDPEGRLIRHLTLAIALSHLGQPCMEVLRLHYAEGYSAPEIGRRLRKSGGAVKQLLHPRPGDAGDHRGELRSGGVDRQPGGRAE
jgi:RNA polymerase sigma factor (sigma-70 family)